MNKNIRIPLAHRLFETMIENSSDRDLNELYETLLEYKTQYFRTYQGLRKVPFIRDLFNIISDQYAYRNQMEEELVS